MRLAAEHEMQHIGESHTRLEAAARIHLRGSLRSSRCNGIVRGLNDVHRPVNERSAQPPAPVTFRAFRVARGPCSLAIPREP